MVVPANRMGPKMVALCSAAVGVIYVAGYVVTLPVAADSARAPTTAAAGVPAAGAPTAGAATPAPPSRSQQRPAAAAKGAKYRDGTYTGLGANRIGSVEVAVTVQDDLITSVQITDCETRYPERYIAQLPQQVLSRQSARVDVVSGATLSTRNFQNAVQQALAQAAL